jgi:hypothetical protein
MPTHPVGRECQQDAVRLKNLVSEAEQQLIERGMRGVEACEMLKAILRLPHDHTSWVKRKQGLAIFRSEKVLINYWLALPLGESVIVGGRFHVKPLLPAIGESPQFYVLAVSRNRVRLLKATWHGVESVHPPRLPTSIKQALNLAGADRGEQVHSGMRGDLGKEAGVFHGQGGHRDALKDEIVEYFRVIDDALRPVFRDQPWPLILAGVKYELAIFREVSDYDHIADEMLYGGFDYVEDHSLYEQALPLAQRFSEKHRSQILGKYRAVADTYLASDDIEEIIPAAHEGRIDLLLVDYRAEKFGRFDANTKCVEFTDQRDPALDLIELAIAQTLRHGGKVCAATREELPSAGPLRAVLRYV